MIKKIDKNAERLNRHIRIRKKISGTADRPRLSIYRSLNEIYAQIIDDTTGTTIASASTKDKEIKSVLAGKTKVEQASVVGETIAKRASAKKIKSVVYDRGGYLYTGRVKAVAEAARNAGLEF